MEGQTCHSRASEHFAPGLHHLAFSVRDLVGAVKTAIDGGLTVSMAPSSLIAKIGGPEAASQVLRSSAASDAHGSTGVPDFFTFLEGFGKSMNFTLELLDQEFANDYLQLNGHQPHAARASHLTLSRALQLTLPSGEVLRPLSRPVNIQRLLGTALVHIFARRPTSGSPSGRAQESIAEGAVASRLFGTSGEDRGPRATSSYWPEAEHLRPSLSHDVVSVMARCPVAGCLRRQQNPLTARSSVR